MSDAATIEPALRLLCSLRHGARPVDLCDALLCSEEPIGLPGLFGFSDDYVRQFNRWKESHAEGRHSWCHLPTVMACFLAGDRVHQALRGLPLEPLRRWQGCELRLMMPTSLALEGLLRAGLCEHPRVQRAICTLMTLRQTPSCGKDWRCGCRYLDATREIPEPTRLYDFDDVTDHVPFREPSFTASLLHRCLSAHPDYEGSALAALQPIETFPRFSSPSIERIIGGDS